MLHEPWRSLVSYVPTIRYCRYVLVWSRGSIGLFRTGLLRSTVPVIGRDRQVWLAALFGTPSAVGEDGAR